MASIKIVKKNHSPNRMWLLSLSWLVVLLQFIADRPTSITGVSAFQSTTAAASSLYLNDIGGRQKKNKHLPRSILPIPSSSNHYHATILQKIRGGGSQQAAAAGIVVDVVLKDCTAAASAFFGGIRIPASLIAGASLGQMFALAKRQKDLDILNINDAPTTTRTTLESVERILIVLHNVCMLLAFMLSVCTIVVATAANTNVLHGGFNPMAENSYRFLKREMQFEFMTCRLSFLTGQFFFLIAVTKRVFIEFDLFNSENRTCGIAVLASMMTLITQLLSYINTTLHCWPNLAVMWLDFIGILWKRCVSDKLPLQILSVFSGWISIIYGLRFLWKFISQEGLMMSTRMRGEGASGKGKVSK